MSENFEHAAIRHWQDAEILNEQQRTANADQHYGFAAECALKFALCAIGYFRHDHRRWHIDVLWDKMQRTRFQNYFPGLTQVLAGSNRFADWHVDQRYFEDGAIPSTTVETHRHYARRLLKAVQLYRG